LRSTADSDEPPLYELLRELGSASIHFTIGRYREDTSLVTLTLVGERVEVDVFDDGHMEVSRFRGDESIVGGEELVRQRIDENRDRRRMRHRGGPVAWGHRIWASGGRCNGGDLMALEDPEALDAVGEDAAGKPRLIIEDPTWWAETSGGGLACWTS